MGLVDGIQKWNNTRKRRAAAAEGYAKREKRMVDRYGLQPTGEKGRYLLPGGDDYIDINLNNPASIGAAVDVLEKRDRNAQVKTLTKKQRSDLSSQGGRFSGLTGAFTDIGMNVRDNLNSMDFGGGAGNYDGGLGDIGGNISAMDFGFGGGMGYDPFNGPQPRSGSSTPRKRKSSSKGKSTKRKSSGRRR